VSDLFQNAIKSAQNNQISDVEDPNEIKILSSSGVSIEYASSSSSVLQTPPKPATKPKPVGNPVLNKESSLNRSMSSNSYRKHEYLGSLEKNQDIVNLLSFCEEAIASIG